MNLASILTDTAERAPEATAFKLDDVELSYGALAEASARMAGVLQPPLDPQAIAADLAALTNAR